MLLNQVMAPLTMLMGLPVEMAIVLTTTLLTNPYAGLIVFSNLSVGSEFTVAQSTILAMFMLLAHSLPVEVLIARKRGQGAGNDFCQGGRRSSDLHIAELFFRSDRILSQPALISLPQLSATVGWQDWTIEQIKALIFVQIVIVVLLFFLEGLRVIGVERLIKLALNPFLRFMGVAIRPRQLRLSG